MNYCPLCRTPLVKQAVDDRTRLSCPDPECIYVYWNNPVPVVAGLIQYRDRYLLARNKRWPAGVYSLIAGYLESGETPENAIMRELNEELGLTGSKQRFIGHYSLYETNQLILAYWVEADGRIQLGEEISEIQSLDQDQLKQTDFGDLALTAKVVNDWFRYQD